MNLFYFFTAVGLTVFITFIFFRLFGQQSNNIFVSESEKKSWDEKISGSLKKLLTTTNIFGTVTSLATLLFLAGSAKLFGIFAFATGITFAFSGFITNPITKKFLLDESIKRKHEDNNQIGGVIASLFWADNKSSRNLSIMVKYISMFAIFSIIWLEVSLFSNFASSYLNVGGVLGKTIIATLTFFIILFFVVKYGLRGFVFADLFHTPIIIIMGLVLIGILVKLFLNGGFTLSAETFLIPKLNWIMGFVFMFHVLVLNLFQVICTEPHWFRLWLFNNVEISSQKAGVIGTGSVWLLLLFIGFSTYAITSEVGEDAIGILLTKLSVINPYFIFFFWIAATGALFSTVDTQLYSFLLLASYKISDGKLPKDSKRFQSPFSMATFSAIVFAVVYYIVKYFNLPFEKILLVVVPFSIVLLPLFVSKYFDRVPSITSLVISVLGYVLIAATGFVLPIVNFFATLSAVFFPVVVSFCVIVFTKKIDTLKIKSPKI